MAKEVKYTSVGGCKLKAMGNFEACFQSMREKIKEHEGLNGDWEVTSKIGDNGERSVEVVLLPLPQKKDDGVKLTGPVVNRPSPEGLKEATKLGDGGVEQRLKTIHNPKNQ